MSKIYICFMSLLGLMAVLIPAVVAQETFPYVARVTVDNTNLRAGQNINFEVLDQVHQGDELVVVGESFDWKKVKLPASANAFVSAAFVKDLGDNVYQVQGNRLNVRALPQLKSAVICQLKEGELITGLEKKDDWLKIEPPQECVGWIIANNIVKTNVPVPAVRLVKAPQPAKNNNAGNLSPAKPPEPVLITGIVEALNQRTLSPEVRHEIVDQQKAPYYLLGYRNIIDGFVNQKVHLTGQVVPGFRSDKPVLLVTKITLVL